MCRQRKRKAQTRRANSILPQNNVINDSDSEEQSDWSENESKTYSEKQILRRQSEVYATEIVRKLKKELLDKRDKINKKPIDELVENRTLAEFHSLCLRFMRSNRTQVLPNADVLVPINHHGFHINKQIILGFSLALGLSQQQQEEEKGEILSFSDFLYDSHILQYTRSTLLLALQAFANATYKKYRLFVFSSDNDRAPEFKGNRLETHRHALGVYIQNNKVYAVTNVSRLFNAKPNIYCPDCATSFNSNQSFLHKKSCPLRCPNCCMYGYDYPCTVENVIISCCKCNRVFNNTKCFESHLEVVCKKVKCCPDCAETYVIDRPTYQHQCHFKKCKLCHKFHARIAKCMY